MARKPNPYLIDADAPALTDEELAAMRPAHEVLPPEILAELTRRRPGQRGPGKRAPKKLVTLRLDADVVSAFQATGPGWQTRINAVVRRGAAALRERPSRLAADATREGGSADAPARGVATRSVSLSASDRPPNLKSGKPRA